MLSPTLLQQSRFSEDQFIADLTSLFKRRNIRFGEPQNLERLAADLAADDAFRAGLFNLCTVISRMSEVELTPRELLVLVARASGGPEVFDAEGMIAIPPSAESAFLTGYQAWTRRGSDLDLHLDGPAYPRSSEPFHAAMALSAAEGFRPPAATASSPRTIPPNTPLDSLTLAELRQYLDDIERRVSQIGPHLHQETLNISPAPAHFEQLDAQEPEGVHNVQPPAPTSEPEPTPFAETPDPAPEPELAAGSIDDAVTVENGPALAEPSIAPEAETPQAVQEPPALAVESTASLEQPKPEQLKPEQPKPAIQPYAIPAILASYSTPDAARLRRLRTANIILTVLLVICVAFAAAVAYRYMNSQDQPANPAGTVDRAPAPAIESASPSSTLQSPSHNATQLPPPRSTPPTSRNPNPPKPPQTTSAKAAQPNAAPASQPAPQSEIKPPAPVTRQSPEPASTNPAPTEVASTPASPPPSEARPESAARPNQPTPEPAALQVADARPAAPAAVPLAIAAPILRPQLGNVTVSVSSSKMMAYALTKPAPVNPSSRHNSQDTTVEVVATISKEGKVVSAQALSGTADVRPAAIQAMQAWRFKPYLVDGKPVEVLTTFKFLFKGQ